MSRYALLLALFSAAVVPSTLSAATFTPATSADLQTALTAAAASTEDDTIELQAGTTYFTNDNSNATFVYNAADGGALTITGAGSSILDGNSARQVIQIVSTGADDFQISGVTVQNGQGGSSGIEVVTLGNIQFNDNQLIDNLGGAFAGGGALTSNGTGTSVEARGNEVRGNVGGFVNGLNLGAANGAALTLENNILAENLNDSAFAGGAQIQSNGNSLITVRGNTVTSNSGNFATGIQVQQNGLNDIVFEGNAVSDNVNPVSSFGGVQLQNNSNGNVTVLSNTISGNSGNFATGIRIQNNGDGAILFENNTIANNDNPAATEGGVSLGSIGVGDFQVTNNLVFGNSGGENGGGITIFANAVTINVVNNTVFENSVNQAGGSGGGVFIGGGADTLNINVFNNILFSNTTVDADSGSDLLINTDGTLALQIFNNDFSEACFGASAPFNCDPASVVGLTQGNNINDDPLFIDSAAGDFQLSADSPAINAGDLNAPNLPALDLAGNPRVVNGQVDMGAFEAQPALSVDPASLDFGTVDLTEEGRQVLTLSNDGTVAVTVDGFTLSDDVNFSVDPNGGSNPCGNPPFTIEVGESCTIEVVFSPTSDGDFAGTLTVDSDNPEAISVALTGTGAENGEGDLRGGGCSLGVANIGQGFHFLHLLPLSAVALYIRRRR